MPKPRRWSPSLEKKSSFGCWRKVFLMVGWWVWTSLRARKIVPCRLYEVSWFFIILLWWKIEMADRYREYDGVMRWWRLNAEMMMIRWKTRWWWMKMEMMRDKMNGKWLWLEFWLMTVILMGMMIDEHVVMKLDAWADICIYIYIYRYFYGHIWCRKIGAWNSVCGGVSRQLRMLASHASQA